MWKKARYELNGRMLGRGRGWVSQWGSQCVYVQEKGTYKIHGNIYTEMGKYISGIASWHRRNIYLHTFDRNSIVMIYRSPFLIQFNMYRTHSYFTTGGGRNGWMTEGRRKDSHTSSALDMFGDWLHSFIITDNNIYTRIYGRIYVKIPLNIYYLFTNSGSYSQTNWLYTCPL